MLKQVKWIAPLVIVTLFAVACEKDEMSNDDGDIDMNDTTGIDDCDFGDDFDWDDYLDGDSLDCPFDGDTLGWDTLEIPYDTIP